MNNVFLTDALGQPDAMREAMCYYNAYDLQMSQIAELKPRQVLFTGMGSSHYCSQAAVILLNQGGIPARMESASEILHYEMNAISPDTLLVLTSQSGESVEIVSIVERLSSEQMVIGITNNPDSTLGHRANILLEMHVAPELAVSTRTYLSSLILSDMLASALLGRSYQTSLCCSAQAIDALEAFAVNYDSMQNQMTEFLNYPDSLCYIGRGYAVSTAECGALFTRETAKYPALGFDSGEFRHGPYEMVDKCFCAIVFAPAGVSFQMQKNLTEAIIKQQGRVIFVTDAQTSFDSDLVMVLKHPQVDERYATLVQIFAAQLFANSMALHRGYAPGVFRQSSKITVCE